MVLDDSATLDKIIAEAIAAEKLERRDKEGENLIYAQNQQKPYTGWVKIMYDNRQTMSLAQYRDGQLDGQAASWDEDGQTCSEWNYKDGKLMTIVAWKPNGEKCPDTNVVNGNGFWVRYKNDGTEEGRVTFEDGEIVID